MTKAVLAAAELVTRLDVHMLLRSLVFNVRVV
jgi:hypothetical protein